MLVVLTEEDEGPDRLASLLKGRCDVASGPYRGETLSWTPPSTLVCASDEVFNNCRVAQGQSHEKND